MTAVQIEQARTLKAEGKTYRQIASALGVSTVAVWRVLRTTEESETEASMSQTSQADTNTEDGKCSTVIATHIAEAEAQSGCYEAELARILAEKEQLLGAVSIDHEALTALEATEERLTKGMTNLRSRIALLERQQEEAETQEAHTRVNQIAARMERLSTEFDAALLVFKKAEDEFTRAIESLVAFYSEGDEITEEMEFLVERYEVARRELTNLGKLPDRLESSAHVFESFRRYWQRQEHHSSEWRRKLEALWDERRKRKSVEPQSNEPLYTATLMNL